MNKTCIAIQHIQFEDLGSFAIPIRKAGYDIHYRDAAKDDLACAKTADLVVFLGGPIGVYEEAAYPFLTQELEIAGYCLDTKTPTLAICLGAQIIAKAAGADVYAGGNGKEIGWKPILLNQAGQKSVIAPLNGQDAQMFHWHGDTFDLPEGATLLASTDSYSHQIFSIDDHLLAFQCHPELDPASIENWLVGHAFEIAKTHGVDAVTLRRDTHQFAHGLVQRGQKSIAQWLQKQHTRCE